MTNYNDKFYNTSTINEMTKIQIDRVLLDILYEFAGSVDYQGAADGDYDKAIKRIKSLIK